jgi:hypothetical protein
VTPEQHQWVRDWVSAFMVRGSRTFRNFQDLLANGLLSPHEVALLVGDAASQ